MSSGLLFFSKLQRVGGSYLSITPKTDTQSKSSESLPGLASSFFDQGRASSLIYDDIDRASFFDPFIDRL